MTKLEVIDLYDFYNFVVDNIFHLKSFTIPKFYSNSYILKFKFWIVETKSDGERTKTEIVNLSGFYNFVFDDFSIRNYVLFQNCRSS